ncbi:hypothetical protein HDU98_010153 [Podochytrium sp. JEL0797]|nr:hypothetical protein HDU98_010153 [Podochytrium sp. JEL0797]
MTTAHNTPALFVFKGLPNHVEIGGSLSTSTPPWLDIVVGAEDGVEATADVVFELVGLARVALAFGSVSEGDRSDPEVRRFNSEEVFSTKSFKVADAQKLAKGSHTFSLAMSIPTNLPPTFTSTTLDRSEIFSIRYVFRATLPLRDSKVISLDHPIVLRSAIMSVESMEPLKFLDVVGKPYGSVLSVQSRRNMFRPLKSVTLLYAHGAPPNIPIKSSFLEVVQKAVLPDPNGSRRVIERIISTFELPGIPQGMMSTYTLQFTLPQLPPSLFVGPIDVAYFLRLVTTYPDAIGGHEVFGPIDFEVLPDVQKIELPPGFDESVEVLEGMSDGSGGPIVRPRLLTLAPWSPPEFLPQPQLPDPIVMNRPHMMPGAPMMIPPQWGIPFPHGSTPMPAPAVFLSQDELRHQMHLDEQARQIAAAQTELERIQLETARDREILAQQSREEAERAYSLAVQETEQRLQQERAELELLKERVNRMKQSASVRANSASEASSSTDEASSSVSSLPPQPTALSPAPPSHPPPDFATPSATMIPIPMGPSPPYAPELPQKPISRAPTLTAPVSQTAMMSSPVSDGHSPTPASAALQHHAYPTPTPLTTVKRPPPRPVPDMSFVENQQQQQQQHASPPIPPQQQQKPKKKWWFSKPQPAQNAPPTSPSTSTVQRSSSTTKLSELEQLVNQVCEESAAEYRKCINRDYKKLMGARERDTHKRRILANCNETVQHILKEDEVKGVTAALEAEFCVVDSETLHTFETSSTTILVRQIRSLHSGLQAAIHADAVTTTTDLQEQCAAVLQPLRKDLTQSVFYAGMSAQETRSLEDLANRVWGEAMRVFDGEVRVPLERELQSKSVGGNGMTSGSGAGGGGGASSSSSSSWGRSRGGGGGGSGGGGGGDANGVCLRQECGKNKVGYGQSGLFCSVKCESLMIQEQTKAMGGAGSR